MLPLALRNTTDISSKGTSSEMGQYLDRIKIENELRQRMREEELRDVLRVLRPGKYQTTTQRPFAVVLIIDDRKAEVLIFDAHGYRISEHTAYSEKEVIDTAMTVMRIASRLLDVWRG